jgi:hypothetical protein
MENVSLAGQRVTGGPASHWRSNESLTGERVTGRPPSQWRSSESLAVLPYEWASESLAG